MTIIEDVGEPPDELSRFIKHVTVVREEITFTDEETGVVERVGDYTNDTRDFLLERKSAFDYLNSVLDGRYLRQLYKMQYYFSGPKFVVFEGDWEAMLKVAAEKGQGMYSHLVASRLKAIAFNVNWIQTWDKSDTANFIMQLNEFAKHNQEIKIPTQKPNVVMCNDERVRMLSVPIGQDKTTKLLTTFGSIANIIDTIKTNPDSIVHIEGIGPKTFERLYEVFFKETEVAFNGRRKSTNRRDTGADSTQSGRVRNTKKSYAKSQYIYRRSRNDKRNS